VSKRIAHEDLQLLALRLKSIVSDSPHLNFASISFKSHNDAVTNVDILFQDKIIELINDLDPNVKCLSEEAEFWEGELQDCWIIDPLDGTSNFIQGLRPSAISIAKVSGKDVLAALVIDLSNLDVYSAVKAKGARLNFRKIEVLNSNIQLIGMSTGYLRAGGLIPSNWNVRVIGSQALQLCFVAMGTLSSTISNEAKAWDDAAGSLIVEESGGLYMHEYMDQSWCMLATSMQSLRSRAITSALDEPSKKEILELNNEE
jgi:myo-inositol-1(or 4)-monophosphatase